MTQPPNQLSLTSQLETFGKAAKALPNLTYAGNPVLRQPAAIVTL